MLSVSDLPTLNAALNATSAALLALGYVFIRRRQIRAHRLCMLSAFTTSALFLASYLIYHLQVGSLPFAGQGMARPVYYGILLSHVSLAILVVPLGLTALYLALTKRFVKHKGIAHRTLPLWLYVSVTGVVVYLMLYHLFPSAQQLTVTLK